VQHVEAPAPGASSPAFSDKGVSQNRRRPWYAEVTRDAWRALLAAGLGWLFEVFDIYALALTAPALIAVFALSKADIGLVTSVSAGGAILGGVAFGWVADRIGRVPTLFLTILVYSLFTGAIVFASSLGWLIALRLLGALGMGGAWTAGASLVAETWHPDHRGKGGALMQMGLPLGSMLAIAVVGLVTMMAGGLETGGWRWIYGIGALPIIILLLVARNTPESPIWLRGRAERQRTRGFHELFRGKAGRGLLVAFAFIFCVQYVYWAVFTWTPTFLVVVKHLAFIKSLGFTLTQQLGSLAGFLIFAGIVDRLGRRPTFMLYLAIGAGAMVTFVLAESPQPLLVANFMTGFGIGGIFAGMGPFTAELIGSTHARALGMAIAYNGGRIGGLIAPLVIGLLASDEHGFQAGMLTTTIAFALAMAVLLFAPETKGMKIE
jgi:MFS family permease